ncbi:colicin E3/pyocin S6 family cytotoxin [Pseudomonas sp. HS6]|uniref:colicin E3/pyocin S6 family cytotoxin n=1 Tax=Pseudomonas sp. HS6 TaxID=2850559 RepID=UPI00201865FB|nr:colicin E3/pyocin S6 family cytotoxin [Pseudomonas sp. HS6]UQS15492.1 S-type pyocin domain-containing protein [Pseudomonas sp. HS6]
MAGQKDIPRVPNPPAGDGHHVTYRYLTATELADQQERQDKYDAMLARQDAFERNREVAANKPEPVRAGCVFAKSCKLPDAIIDYSNSSGMVPTDSLKDYGEVVWLGAREVDEAGLLNLETISGSTVSLEIGRLALRAPTLALPTITALGAGGAALLSGLVAALWTPTLGDSALYTEDQLRALKQARTRVRLHVEQQADGSLKGYGFYTGKNRDWEMVDVAQFTARGNRFIADLGEGIELIWTPAVDGSDILGIPALEAAPQAPHIWVYPPTKAADGILVNPIYPPEYRDFILVFPAGSGVKPLYIVVNARGDIKYHPAPTSLSAFPDVKSAPMKTSVRGGGKKRRRWKDASGKIYEWDSQHGKVEMYTKQGKHLGEYDPETGEQTKPADPTRSVEK